LHANNREMEFGKWMEYCIKTICGVFQIDPIEIGFDISKQGSGQSGSSSGLGQGNQAERVMFSQDKGLRPLLVFISSLINDYIVWRIDPNFEFEFVGLNQDSEKDDLDRSIAQGKAFKTINEIRAEHDLEPLKAVKDLKTMDLGDIILDPSFIQVLTAQSAPDPAEGGQMGPDGMPMNPDDPNTMMNGPDGAGGDGGKNDPNMTQDDGPNTGAGSEAEPDYENMSVDELNAEMQKLQSAPPGAPGAQGAAPAKPGAKASLPQPSAQANQQKLKKAKLWKSYKELEL
jgi:hypothetical protein